MDHLLENILIAIVSILLVYLLYSLVGFIFSWGEKVGQYFYKNGLLLFKKRRYLVSMLGKTYSHTLKIINLIPIKKHQTLIIVLSMAVLVFFSYRDIFQTFFEGDEWYYFGLYFPKLDSWFGIFYAVYSQVFDARILAAGNHMSPLAYLLFAFSMKLFGLNFWPYALSSLIIHIINCVLLIFLCWRLLPNKKVVGIIAGIYFATTSVHYHAVTWVMNYLLTTLSVTFILLSLLKFLAIIQKIPTKKDVLVLIFLILCALLTKESAIIIFPLIVLITFLKKAHIGKFLKSGLASLFSLFLFYQLILPEILLKVQHVESINSTTKIFDFSLLLFRIFAYPFKAFSQVFLHSQFINFLAEELTPFAYPSYGAEKAVRGTTFLTFTQTAGSDMVGYIFSTISIFLILILIYMYRKSDNFKNALLIGIGIIALSVWPLIMVARYAPAFAYITFIDSRHLYLTGVGGAIIFSIGVLALSTTLSKFKHFKDIYRTIFIILILWIGFQSIYLNKEFKRITTMGNDRTEIVNKIMKSQPSIPEKAIFYIDSDSSYYGFAELMPPFQTNFGQVLITYYFQKKELPAMFLADDFLSKKGIAGQGYKEHQGHGFGYFLSKYKAIEAIEKNGLSLDNLFVFKWEGKKHLATNETEQIRSEVEAILKDRSAYKDWTNVKYPDMQLSFKIPPNSTAIEEATSEGVLKNIAINSPLFDIDLKVRVKTNGVGIDPNVKPLKDSEGNIIGDNFSYRYIKMNNGETLTSTVTTKGSSIKYFFPTNIPPDKIIELTVNGQAPSNEVFHKMAEKFISFIVFPDIVKEE